jgi:hypothetical protein
MTLQISSERQGLRKRIVQTRSIHSRNGIKPAITSAEMSMLAAISVHG